MTMPAQRERARTRKRLYLLVAAVAVICAAVVQTASAVPGEVAGPAAAALCTTSYPGTTGPEQLSPCQWDMRAIKAGAAPTPWPPARA